MRGGNVIIAIIMAVVLAVLALMVGNGLRWPLDGKEIILLLACDLLVVGPALLLLIALLSEAKQDRSRQEPRNVRGQRRQDACANCGKNLTGNVSGVCRSAEPRLNRHGSQNDHHRTGVAGTGRGSSRAGAQPQRGDRK